MASVNLLSAMASSPARPRPVKSAPASNQTQQRGTPRENRTEPKGFLRVRMAAASTGGGAVVRRGWLAALHLGRCTRRPRPSPCGETARANGTARLPAALAPEPVHLPPVCRCLRNQWLRTVAAQSSSL